MINDIKKEEQNLLKLKNETKKLDKLEYAYKYKYKNSNRNTKTNHISKPIKLTKKRKTISRKYTVDGLPILFKIKKRHYLYNKNFDDNMWICNCSSYNIIKFDLTIHHNDYIETYFLNNNKISIKDMRFILKQDRIIHNKNCLSNKMIKILYKTFYFEDEIFIV